jgi:putative oxidoreductase
MNSSTQSRTETALFVLRVVIGIIMLAHGAQKLFMLGVPGVTQGFAQMGVPAPTLTAPFISILELLGGLALIVGLLARLAALGLACDMIGAILFVHLKNGFFAPMGFEFPLSLLAALIAIAMAGGGALSIDGALARRRASTTI